MRYALLLLLCLTGCAGTTVRQTYEIDGNPADMPTYALKLEIEKTF